MASEGGTTGSRHATRASESPLGGSLRLHRGLGASRWGFFLRAETMHGYYTYLEDNPGSIRSDEPHFHEMSHGESFLAVLRSRFDQPAFYCLDEPEAALSFSSTLALMGVLHDLAREGGQVLCATHSPVLASLPGATVLEVGDWGYRRTTWDELELVTHWKAYLDAPGRYLRHVLD
ncbi:AAA family ATPase [Nocardioides sp.]|uniref:AAA family ATPase n=1 Tax=Nocardioides sp. TaxID=35761 RepID=UPI00271D610A|nr:AAA family ATPase [Nocardioides sp.]MDO9455692.1 AAA family ATPase [Nocardioides sp.]